MFSQERHGVVVDIQTLRLMVVGVLWSEQSRLGFSVLEHELQMMAGPTSWFCFVGD